VRVGADKICPGVALTSGVSTKCHLRVWRSDVEVVVDPERTQKIEKRRQKRGQALCKCSEYDRMQQE